MIEQSAISRKDNSEFPWSVLAYFFGAWLGDGWYSWNPYKRIYSIGIKCMDSEIVSRCRNDSLECITDLNPHMSTEMTPKGTKLYKTMWYNKTFTGFVIMTTAAKTMIPEFIWEADKQTKLTFLAGLMDTDGSILKQKNESCRDNFFYRTTFSGTKGFVWQIPDLLRMLNIKLIGNQLEEHLNPRHAKRLIISISLPSLIDSGFRFTCYRKQERLNDAIARRKTRYTAISSETTRLTTDEVEDIVQHLEKSK